MAGSYYDSTCKTYSLGQRLIIPTVPTALEYILNPEDLQYNTENADANLKIKYARFTREFSASFKSFNITLYHVPATDVKAIKDFATSDFLNNVMTTGRGSISLYYLGDELTNLYIPPPIEKSISVYQIWETGQPEVFESLSFKVVSPDVTWY